MGEVRFMISEAAKQVDVESHVLRYWEEELGLKIGRTEMGHRYYTDDDIQLFRCIKKLKDEGMMLKDLKAVIPELKETRLKLKAPGASQNSTAGTALQNMQTAAAPADDAPSAPEIAGTPFPSVPVDPLIPAVLLPVVMVRSVPVPPGTLVNSMADSPAGALMVWPFMSTVTLPQSSDM